MPGVDQFELGWMGNTVSAMNGWPNSISLAS
jgi:hypothetical protein